MDDLHYIEKDLGSETDPSWLDKTYVLLEYEIYERLAAERLMDDFEVEDSC